MLTSSDLAAAAKRRLSATLPAPGGPTWLKAPEVPGFPMKVDPSLLNRMVGKPFTPFALSEPGSGDLMVTAGSLALPAASALKGMTLLGRLGEAAKFSKGTTTLMRVVGMGIGGTAGTAGRDLLQRG